jgi:hypothetical protein
MNTHLQVRFKVINTRRRIRLILVVPLYPVHKLIHKLIINQ